MGSLAGPGHARDAGGVGVDAGGVPAGGAPGQLVLEGLGRVGRPLVGRLLLLGQELLHLQRGLALVEAHHLGELGLHLAQALLLPLLPVLVPGAGGLRDLQLLDPDLLLLVLDVPLDLLLVLLEGGVAVGLAEELLLHRRFSASSATRVLGRLVPDLLLQGLGLEGVEPVELAGQLGLLDGLGRSSASGVAAGASATPPRSPPAARR